jgi:predicted Fe-S protein YdhL (DUF1289 family)
MTNQAASNLAKLRWAKTTPEERAAFMAELRSKRTGGKRNLSAEQRAAIGKRLAEARAAKRQARQS